MEIPAKICVVVPALNEEAHIQACLSCLEAQTLPRDRFEVILVDNGSTDRTVAVAGGFETRLALRILSLPGCTISELRNRGAALATGPILAFLDADCMPQPTWLEEALVRAQENTLWGAHYLIPHDATWVGRTWFKYQATAQAGTVSYLPAGCLFLTRSAFIALGGFDSSVETGEDVELCERARAQGMNVIAYPALAVYHEGTPRTLSRFYRQNRWHGKHLLQVVLASLPSTRIIPLLSVTVYTLVMFWAALLVPLLVLPHHVVLAILPLSLLLLPPFLLAVGKTLKSHSPLDAPALFLLYLTYFLARAASLTHLFLRRRR